MEWQMVGVIVVLVGLVISIVKPLNEWAAQLAENTQSMRDLRGEFAKWDSRNEAGHTELKQKIEKNRDEVDDEIIRNREEVNGTLIEHQRKLEGCRIDLDNHEARLQIIEHKK